MQIPRGSDLTAAAIMLTAMAIVWGSIPVVLALRLIGQI
jgi:hypothetical protein